MDSQVSEILFSFRYHSFEFVKDESNKELASNKKVTLTEEQLKQLYDYPITVQHADQLNIAVRINLLFQYVFLLVILFLLLGNHIIAKDKSKSYNTINPIGKRNHI